MHSHHTAVKSPAEFKAKAEAPELFQVRVLYDFPREQDGDLELHVGDVVSVTELKGFVTVCLCDDV